VEIPVSRIPFLISPAQISSDVTQLEREIGKQFIESGVNLGADEKGLTAG
jgi:hypothetical protein